MTDLDALLDSAALPERTVEVCLRGDLIAQVEDLERQFTEAAANSATMADLGKRRQLGEQIEAVQQQMRDASLVFRLRGVTRKGWVDLLAAHPVRKGNEDDEALGYNTDTFFPAIVRACLVEPEVTDEQWERLNDSLSAGQFEQLAQAAISVSRRKVDIPFSLASVVATLTSDETSKPQSA